MIALIIILAIAPLDSFFEEDGVNVFDINEEEVLISEMLSVITEAAWVEAIGTNDVPVVPTIEGYAIVDNSALY